jgi:hypothetical protein
MTRRSSRPRRPPPPSADDANLKPEPPALVKWIAWLFTDGRRYWHYLLIALICSLGAYIFSAMGWDSDLGAWIRCLNPDENKRLLNCWKN